MKRLTCIAAALLAISLSAPAHAVDDMFGGENVDLTSVRAKIAAKNYAAALKELRDLVDDNQEADVYNLLGFTLRKTVDPSTALYYYLKALELKPDHLGAHEYLGELYVETGKLDKAREQLDALVKLCPSGCEQRADLQQAIDKAKN
jgi:tetratricopeptide (TPR) repeat protein